MRQPPRVTTASALLQYRPESGRQELIAGSLHEFEPAGALHGVVAARVLALLAADVMRYDLGETFGAETGFQLRSDPDTVRAPDASFVTRERIARTGIPAGYWPGAPDLAVEVISPSDRASQIEAKALDWLAAGARAVVVLDPSQRTAAVHRTAAVRRAPSRVDALGCEATLELGDVVPGFAVPVADLFV